MKKKHIADVPFAEIAKLARRAGEEAAARTLAAGVPVSYSDDQGKVYRVSPALKKRAAKIGSR